MRQRISILFPSWFPPGPPVVAARCDSRGSGPLPRCGYTGKGLSHNFQPGLLISPVKPQRGSHNGQSEKWWVYAGSMLGKWKIKCFYLEDVRYYVRIFLKEIVK